MKALFSYLLLICFLFSFSACQKEPRKGEYKGTFTGNYPDGYHYTTVYYFIVTQSNKQELRLEEKRSGTISALKKHPNDSISGMIGFAGKIYNPDKDGTASFQAVKINGTYKSNTISGTFHTTFTDGNKQYDSTGDFSIIPFW